MRQSQHSPSVQSEVSVLLQAAHDAAQAVQEACGQFNLTRAAVRRRMYNLQDAIDALPEGVDPGPALERLGPAAAATWRAHLAREAGRAI